MVIAGLDAELQIRVRIGMRRTALADGRVLNGQRRTFGMHHRVDGHGIDRVVHEQRINAVFHADVFARVGKDDLRERLFAFCVVHQRRVHVLVIPAQPVDALDDQRVAFPKSAQQPAIGGPVEISAGLLVQKDARLRHAKLPH